MSSRSQKLWRPFSTWKQPTLWVPPHRRDTGSPTVLSSFSINTSYGHMDLSPLLCWEVRDWVTLSQQIFIEVLFILDSLESGLRCLQPLPDVSACPISVPFWHHLTDFPQGLSDPAECSFDGLWFWPVLRLGQSEHCLPDCRDWLREGHMTQSEPMSCNLGVLAREALSSHWIGGWEEDLLMACCWCSNDRGAILMVGLGSACSYFATVQGEPHLRKMSAGTVGLREAERTFLHLFLLHLFVKP